MGKLLVAFAIVLFGVVAAEPGYGYYGRGYGYGGYHGGYGGYRGHYYGKRSSDADAEAEAEAEAGPTAAAEPGYYGAYGHHAYGYGYASPYAYGHHYYGKRSADAEPGYGYYGHGYGGYRGGYHGYGHGYGYGYYGLKVPE